MQVTVKEIRKHEGGAVESNWKRDVQMIMDTEGNLYVNTPSISGDTFEVGKTYDVGLGNAFGRSTGTKYRTININKKW